jgi:hypothetical protein
MKILKHKYTRTGDNVTLEASWRDNLKRPCSVRVQASKDVQGNQYELSEILSGDVREVDGILEGLAEIAWDRGWRPRGLVGFIANHLQNFKLPPRE